ncbi:putative C6 finger domain protein [Aspergillus saccharolyticus JOP 1030-1]|uniref:Zn(2)-C6 fungal-type domain-containing protein n=1 Tax=Aspergillus saccharolyticus JOP 1030-1 TaxID=1450539 RepID=A0A318Z606_9EURO|nr:hypothetical protein BP01DRAFT_157953 [Aspergillus saccharolyticus JOP 1030-1]PYH41884.1 hypothetical protein BP01DRAFT_157953 [Aspergillus saccharolyticus JOP 1030-1]
MSSRDTEEAYEVSLPRKRYHAEAVDYPRRRATVACQICRLRKTRCNGERPRCQLCADLDAECIYREPGIKLDAGDKLIIEKLDKIECLLRSRLIGEFSNSPLSSTTSETVNDPASNGDAVIINRAENTAAPSRTAVVGLGFWANSPTNISTMPKLHTTPALNLLQWPFIRDLVASPYDPHTLLQLEMAREPLRIPSYVGLDISNATTHAKAFFARVNVWYACVNPYSWPRYYDMAISSSFQDGAESCVVLLVLALGCASQYGSISTLSPEADPPGLPYFVAAWGLLPNVTMRNSVLAAQCNILASAYLFYLVRPLEAWTLLSSASLKLQLLFGNPSRVSAQWRELSTRLYWNTLLHESDLLAELDLPHSGIVHYEEIVDLPGGFEPEDYEDENQSSTPRENTVVDAVVGHDELWYFLAEIALRRLLNRVSHVIYQEGNSLTLASLGPVASELDFQLSQWYEGLPQAVRFPLSSQPASNSVQTVLRLRYFACRTIIYRPYILAVLQHEQISADPMVRECCRRCLDATINQLDHISRHREGHLPYLWQGALSMVSQTLLIMGSTMSPALSALLPSSSRVNAIISGVKEEVDRYAHLAPSLKLSAEIIRDAERRRQTCLTTMAKQT